MNKPVKAIVLAAGRGTRLRTEGCDLPKVMRSANGTPLLRHVLSALDFLPQEDIVIVVGYKKELIYEAFPNFAFAEQAEQRGTGHAVMAASRLLPDFEGDLLVCCGDMPLIRRETYEALLRAHRDGGAPCTILSGTASLPLPYGRILRDAAGSFSRIVEDRDCSETEREAEELNSGVYIFDAAALRSVLGRLSCGNTQGEYYLTDAPGLLLSDGCTVDICRRELGMEIIGVNTPEQLDTVSRILRETGRETEGHV